MSYEVLARKLRPMGFDALVGQDHVVRALRHALDAGRLHHAYLFTGTRGVGKTTIARLLAKSLNCETGVSSSPCGTCSICLEIKENRFIDLIEVDAASRTGVDDTREILENAQYLPTRGRYKVYLIDEVHMLSNASFNALLKTLEEPPAHVKFLLATTNPKKVPATVLSRCLQFQLKNLSREAIAGYLAEVLVGEKVEFEQSALDIIARSAAGSMRDALSLTDQGISYGQGALRAQEITDMLGVVGRDEVASLLRGLAGGSAAELLQLSAELAERGVDFADVLKGLLEALHDLSVECALRGAVDDFSAEELQLYYQIALLGHRDLSISPDERSGFEMTLLRMLAFSPQSGSQVPPRAQDTTTDPDSKAQTGPSAAKQAEQSGTTENLQKDTRDVEQHVAQHTVTASAAADEQWFEIVAKLDVGGVTRMIAEHSVLQKIQLPNIELLLDSGHDTLLNAAQVDHLSRALSEALGQPVELQVNTGAVESETPAQRRERQQQERQARAEQTISEDANVRGLVAQFGGRVDQIRPI